jgi:hypothetical protein
MALKLLESIKGIECEYWHIFRADANKHQNHTLVRLALYQNKYSRDLNLGNYMKIEAIKLDGIDYTFEQIYFKIKESKLVQDTSEDGTPKVDEEGNPVMIESNKFVLSEDC